MACKINQRGQILIEAILLLSFLTTIYLMILAHIQQNKKQWGQYELGKTKNIQIKNGRTH